MTITPEEGSGKGKMSSLTKAVTFTPLKLKDLEPSVAAEVLKKTGFPTGTETVAQAGWSGHTEVTKKGLRRLLSDAEAEAAAQQSGK